MKMFLKLATTVAIVIALFFGLNAMIEEPADARATICPALSCGTETGLTYLGTCYNAAHDCLGFLYENQENEICFISAEQ